MSDAQSAGMVEIRGMAEQHVEHTAWALVGGLDTNASRTMNLRGVDVRLSGAATM